MLGLVSAKHFPKPEFGLWPLVICAGLLGLLSLFLAASDQWSKRLGWAACLICGVTIAGFVMLHLRHPFLHHQDERPPREVTVTIEALHVFSPVPGARSLTGYGRIIAAGPLESELVGRRVYFSVIRRISVAPHRSGHYLMTGVLEPASAEPPQSGFEEYLHNLGVRGRLTRAHATEEIKPPSRFRKFCSLAQHRLQTILHHGVERHPEIISLYVAMLLGEKAVLSSQQQDAFMRSGTFHIFSVSGLHVGVISVAIYGMLQFIRVPRRANAVISLALLWLYVEITGGSSPAQRSFLMIAFLLASQVWRFPGNALAALVSSAVCTLLFEPLQLFNTGFQMSYGVVIALVVMSVPLGQKWLNAWRPFGSLPLQNWRWWQHAFDASSRFVIGLFAASWVAFVASTPAGVGYFGILSIGALLANMVVIPLSSLALIAGFISLVTGLLGLLPLSALFNSAAVMILIAADWLVTRGTALPGMYFDATFRLAWMTPAAMAFLTALMLACVGGGWRRRYGGYWPPVVALGLIIIFCVKFGGQ
jgi:competence protein ComEC